MRVLGIDPGLATTGYGIIEQDEDKGSPRLVEAGIITTSAKESTPKRLWALHKETKWLIAEFKPNALAVELVFFSANAKTAIDVAQARGVILLAGHKLTVRSYTPLEVKRQITGYGRAKKLQVQGMMQRLLNLQEIPKPDDAADALAVALCYLLEEQARVRGRERKNRREQALAR